MRESIQNWLDEILVVCVLYEMRLENSPSILSLDTSLGEVGGSVQLLVFDNSPTRDNSTPKTNNLVIDYHFHGSNVGVSKAYNEGFRRAQGLGKKWLLLVDQDTHFPGNSVRSYYEAILKHTTQSCFVPQLHDSKGIISPFRFWLGNGFRVNSVRTGIQSLNRLRFVNSGLLIGLEAFESSNGYDDAFPLDMSDFAFIERLQKVLPAFVCIDVRCDHEFSASSHADLPEDLQRFSGYKASAIQFRRKYRPYNYLIDLRVLVRSIKLSAKHRSLRFIHEFLTP